MTKRDLDMVSLVAGGIFLALGAAYSLHLATGLVFQVRWVWPVLLIAVGLAVLLSSRPR